MLERAIAIALQAHTGAVDKGGAPYILHPLRLMLRFATAEEQIVAVLHDVVEDSDWTLDQLRAEGFSEMIVQAIDAMTRRHDETYMNFIQRAAQNQIARNVKRADLEDNMDLNRIPEHTENDLERIERYKRAHSLLTNT